MEDRPEPRPPRQRLIHVEPPAVCAHCRVVVMHDGRNWTHAVDSPGLPYACSDPKPERRATSGEIRRGEGRSKGRSKDQFSITGALEDIQSAFPPDQPVTVATDGSYKIDLRDQAIRHPISWGYVATNGIYGCGSAPMPHVITGPDKATVAELRAIWWALHRLVPDHSVTIVTDSMDSVELVEAWRAGDTRMPFGYRTERRGGRIATLTRLARLVTEHPNLVTATWVRGHSGHPLNEAADALAKVGRAWANRKITTTEAEAAARRTATGVLASTLEGPSNDDASSPRRLPSTDISSTP
jgi:ribonuclease HI